MKNETNIDSIEKLPTHLKRLVPKIETKKIPFFELT